MDLSLFDLTNGTGVENWSTGANSSNIIVGTYNGVRYRIKEHNQPQWRRWAEQMRIVEREIQDITDSGGDPSGKITEKEAMSRKEAAWNKEDAQSDQYLAEKNKINRLVAKPELKDVVFSATEMWLDRNPKWGNKVRAVEAVREVNISMSFNDASKPLAFINLNKEQQMEILATFAEQYQKIHNLGIVHSDIKMTNMLISNVGGKNVGVLIDFDAAFIPADLPSIINNHTLLVNTIGGTLMSPEISNFYNAVQEMSELDCDLTVLTTKADVFSFAIAMYECLMGNQYNELEPLTLIQSSTKEIYTADDGSPITVEDLIGYNMNNGYPMDARLALPQRVADANPHFACLFQWMTEFDYSKRPTMSEVAMVLREHTLYDSGTSSIPAEYLPDGFNSPWNDQYEFNVAGDPSVRSVSRDNQNSGKGQYYKIVFNDGRVFPMQPERKLINMGLLVKKGPSGAAVPPRAPAPSVEITVINPEYQIRQISKDVYEVTRRGAKYTTILNKLIEEKIVYRGTLTPDQKDMLYKRYWVDIKEPWPEDGIEFTPSGIAANITRDIKKETGWYIINGKSYGLTVLLGSKLATRVEGAGAPAPELPPVNQPSAASGEKNTPWPEHNIEFIAKEGIVIERANPRSHNYFIVSNNGKMRKPAFVEALIAQGLAKYKD